MGTKSSQATDAVVVLDAGALIAFERGDAKMRALLREALKVKARIVIPAGVLAQVWRGGARQAILRSLTRSVVTSIAPLNQVLAEACGELCGRAGTSDIVDASVVLVARREKARIVTSDIDDLRRLDRKSQLEQI